MSVRLDLLPVFKPSGRCPAVSLSRRDVGWLVRVVVTDASGRRVQSSSRVHRTLYGARMAARQARIDYAPGGRLYAPVV